MDDLIIAVIEDWLKELIQLSIYIKDARKDDKVVLKGTYISISSAQVYVSKTRLRSKIMYDYCYKEPLNKATIRVMCDYLNVLDKPNYVFDKVWTECEKNDDMWQYYFYEEHQLIKDLLHNDLTGAEYGTYNFTKFI